jgi:ABC-type microcin C transport system permease subunit YejB
MYKVMKYLIILTMYILSAPVSVDKAIFAGGCFGVWNLILIK